MDNKTYPYEHFIFGEEIGSSGPLSIDQVEEILSRGRKVLLQSSSISQERIWKLFERLSKAWADPAYPRRQYAFERLSKSPGSNDDIAQAVLNYFAEILSPQVLAARIEHELGFQSIQDKWVSPGIAELTLSVRPAGQVLRVAPGNIFNGPFESFIDGIITRNVNYMKMSNLMGSLPICFARSLKDFDDEGLVVGRITLLTWQGGDKNVEEPFKRNMDRIVVWGGLDALASWKSGRSPRTVLVQHGPKVSFGVLSRAGLKDIKDMTALTDAITFDITLGDQKACGSPQVLYIENLETYNEADRFINSLAESFKRFTEQFPTTTYTNDERVEVMRFREAAAAEHLITGKKIKVIKPDNTDWTIVVRYYEDDKLEATPLCRTIIIKSYSSLQSLRDILAPHAFYLQTMGNCVSANELLEYATALADAGVTRICPFGIMNIPKAGAPHDGTCTLRDLTRIASLESA